VSLGRSKPPTTKLERIAPSLFGSEPGTKQIIEWLNRNIPRIESWLETLEEMKIEADKQSGPNGSTSASIFKHDGSASVTVNEAESKVAVFDQQYGLSDYIIPSHADDRITVNEHGTYWIFCQVSFSGTANTEYDLDVFINGAENEALHAYRKIGTGNDIGSASLGGLVHLDAGDYAELWVGASGDGKDFTLKHGQLIVSKIGL